MNPTDILIDVIIFLTFFVPTVLAVMLFAWLVVYIWRRIQRLLNPPTPMIPLDYEDKPAVR